MRFHDWFSLKDERSFHVAGWLLAAIATSLALSWYYMPFVIEDALIVYRYTDRFLHGQGLTFNDGEFVEGYSDLLWVLLLAVGGLVQPDLIVVGWILGLAANIAVLVAIAWTFHRSTSAYLLPVASGLFVLGLSGSFALWGIGGLEVPLLAALVGWALATTHRMSPAGGWLYPGLLLGLVAITRPDGILFGLGIAIAVVLRDGFSSNAWKQALRLLLFPLAFFVAQIIFRLYYYGSVVPNTAHVKIAFTPERVWTGVIYVAQGMLVNIVPLLALLGSLLLLWRLRRRDVLRQAYVFLIPGIIWLAYIVVIGGDIFPGHRHWIPALVCFAFALSHLLEALPSYRPGRLAIMFVVASAIHLGWQIMIGDIKHGYGYSPQRAAYPIGKWTSDEWDCIAAGRLLRTAFAAQRPVVAINAAGCLPYTTRFPTVDMLGYTDSYIAHRRPPEMGKGWIGHELGDGAYVLSRKPDLLQFGGPLGSSEPVSIFRGDREIAGLAEFHQYYRLIFVRAGGSVMRLWARIEDGRIGITRTADGIHIPGFLLATTPGVQVVLDKTETPVAELVEGDAILENVTLPEGRWKVTLETDTSSHLRLATTPATNSESIGSDALCIVSDGTSRSFRVFGGRGLVYSITATRSAEPGHPLACSVS